MPSRFKLIALALAFVIGGCAFFKRLEVESMGSSVQKPSNVAVYVKVNDGREPVTGLAIENFNIYENEQLISPEETKQTLLAREVAALHKVLLLVDMSTAGTDAQNRQISRAVANFVTLTRKTQAVTVYAFDGGPKIHLIGDFPKGESGPSELPELDNFKVSDTSRNLNGAVLEGIKELGARLMSEHKQIRVGTLVVIATGPDRAARVTDEQMVGAVDATNEQVIAIGIGDGKTYELDAIGKDGVDWVPSLGGLGPALDDAATKVQSLMERYYLLSYCSPARAGMRRLKVEVVHTTLEGEERKGNLELDFDATGFGPGCDPKATPAFGAAGAVETTPPTPPGDKPVDDGKQPPPTKPNGDPPPAPPAASSGETEEIVPPPNKPGFAPVPK
jgi:hypothetical protein